MFDQPILAIDTSTSACSVALQMPNGQIFSEQAFGSTVHSQALLPMLEKLLDKQGITLHECDAIGVCKGPGSFTGLRIGIGVAQGLAYGQGLPMFGFSSLAALVAQQQDDVQTPYLAAIDARMGEVYWADSASLDWSTGELDIGLNAPEALASNLSQRASEQHGCLVGNAWHAYPAMRENNELSSWQSFEATDLVKTYPLAQGQFALLNKVGDSVLMDAFEFEPVYVRNQVAKVASK